MSKYRLCYRLNGDTKPVDLSKITMLKGKDLTSVETIDSFVMSFNNKNELLSYLKDNGFIETNINNVFIAKERKDKFTKEFVYEKIYNGEYLLFKDDKQYVQVSNIYKFLTDNMRDGKIVREIAEKYYKKYFSGEYGPSHIRNSILSLLNISSHVERNGYYQLTQSEVEEYSKDIENFIIFEFYKFDYDKYTESFIKKRDKDGYSIKNYKNIRSFVVEFFIKNNKYKIDKKVKEEVPVVSRPLIDYEHEEFLTEEDFEKVNEEILSTYQEDNDGPYIDGHDIISPLSKKELKKELENIGRGLVIKGDAYR